MSNFRYLASKTDTRTKLLDESAFNKIINSNFVKSTCDNARKAFLDGNKDLYDSYKNQLPLAMWIGYNSEGKRHKDKQTPTQYFMVDIDHAKYQTAYIMAEFFKKVITKKDEDNNKLYDEGEIRATGVRIIRETPSGGTRFIVLATQDFPSVQEHLEWFIEKYGLSEYGEPDGVTYDFARTDFLVKKEWIHYYDSSIWTEKVEKFPILRDGKESSNAPGTSSNSTKAPEPTEEQRNFKFNGKKVSEIAQEWIEALGGEPEEGQRHAFYNELIKNFRNICDSDPRIVFAVLPLLNGTADKRWSQCISICRTNNTTLIPKEFYTWLVKNGYIESKKSKPLKEYITSDDETRAPLPKLPPVFREFCAICPPDFVYPSIVALLPIMGTLTSYVRADYIDYTEQSTTFFSCVWAPPGCGKSFAKKLVELLMKKIRVRDEINNIREQLYLVDTRTKSDKDKGIDLPHVMVRIMPAINSLPEFLEKMRDNHGFHMFTMAEEVDTFKKGSSSGGADKSDLFRTAWDNSEYGQSFKSAATFKGMVKVYYNILLTGTPGAVKKYYSNVEDGMVTRISICEIENQQFAKFQAWKQLTKKQLEIIDNFVDRCDFNTYRDPLDMTEDDAHLYDSSSSNFDKNVKWKFNLKDKQKIDMQWVFPTILEWLEKTRLQASIDYDQAADTFRRRTAVKGFRMAMVCMCCWAQVRDREKKIIKDFIVWFMDRDLQESLKMFGNAYNDLQNQVSEKAKHHQSLYQSLSTEFTKNDLIAQCIKQGVHSKIKVILFRWRKDGVIQKLTEDKYKKIKKV